jgi:hypothetical protein
MDAPEKNAPFYPHRQNKDGSYDTFCLKCFAIVAHARTEAELEEYKQEHVCVVSSTWIGGRLRLPEE